MEEPREAEPGVTVVEKEEVEVAFQAAEVVRMIKVVVRLMEAPAGYRDALEFLVSEQVESLKQE